MTGETTNKTDTNSLMAKIAAQCIGVGTFDTAKYLRYKKDIAFASDNDKLALIMKNLIMEVLA